MPDSPLDESFSLEKFYTQSSDKHHHGERYTVRVPGDWLHFASVVANSPKTPEYESIADIFRDGFAKAMKVALDHINDPETEAKWSVHLAIAEMEARKSQDERELALADLWAERVRDDHGWTASEFALAMDNMGNPAAKSQMEMLANRYSIAT